MRTLLAWLRTSLLLLCLCIAAAGEARADQGEVRGTLSALAAAQRGEKLFISVETQEGLEQFVLELDDDWGRYSNDGKHLRGEVRPRKGRGSPTAVAVSRVGGRFVVFFTSSRRGLPSSASFSLVKRDGKIEAHSVKLARAARRTLPCGSGRGHQVQHARRSISKGEEVASIMGDEGVSPLSPPRVLDIAARADFDFYLQHGSETDDYMAASLHAAEVLYAAPLGLRFRLASQQVQTAGVSSGGAPVGAALLLEGFRQQVMAEPVNYDVFHLFTGRELDGRTIGIAYVRSACSGRTRFNIGLSKGISAPLQPVLVAHEIAHNLGAYHDSEPNSVMNPVLGSASANFSGTSLSAMKAAVSRVFRCISRLPEHQLTLAVSAPNPQTFSARLDAVSVRSEECSAGLYGRALVSGRPQGPSYRVASQKAFFGAGDGKATVTFQAPMPSAPLSGAEASFQVKLWCRSRTYLSDSQVLRVSPDGTGASTSLPSDSRGWVLLLRKAFGG